MFNVVHDWNLRIACEDKVTVHAMDCEVIGDGSLGGGEALGYYGAAVYPPRSWRMPERSGIGEDILEEGLVLRLGKMRELWLWDNI